jgi:hypothetical protein
MYYFVNSQTKNRCGTYTYSVKKKQSESTSVADPDPGSGAFLTPGFGMFIPDPEKNLVVIPFYVATNFTKL